LSICVEGKKKKILKDPWWFSSKESACNAGDMGLILRKSPCRRKWQPTPVFLPGTEENGRLRSMGVTKE